MVGGSVAISSGPQGQNVFTATPGTGFSGQIREVRVLGDYYDPYWLVLEYNAVYSTAATTLSTSYLDFARTYQNYSSDLFSYWRLNDS